MFLNIFVAGCAAKRENMKIPQAVFDSKPRVVLTQTKGFEKARFYKDGPQGLFLDLAINSMMTNSLDEKVCEVTGNQIVNEKYYDVFQKAFQERAFLASKDEKLLQNVDLKKHSVDEPQFAPYDFGCLNAHSAEYALILEPFFFGVKRTYYGFIPTSAPQGHTHLRIYLVRIKDNTVWGYYDSPVILPVEGTWDSPPHFAEVQEAAKKALIVALAQAYTYFFQNT